MIRSLHPRFSPSLAHGVNGYTTLVSAAVTSVIVFGFWLGDEAFSHWFLLPVLACGVVIGVDMIEWCRGRLNAYDPVGVLGLLGYHFFFLAPLLHVRWDFWMRHVAPPADWRDWLGGMALLNLLGLLIYRLTRDVFSTASPRHPLKYLARRIRPRAFFLATAVALLLSASLQIETYARFGGIMGYISAYDAREDAFEGMGWLFMLSEKFPLLALFGYAVYMRRRARAMSSARVVFVMLVYLLLSMLFGGLRGSRSNTIWSLFWAAGVIHFWLRPLPRRLIYAGIVFLGLFMYIYGFYKGGGSQAVVTVLEDRGQIEDLERRTGRSLEAVILSDLARADVQALILHRMFYSDYELSLGRTYIGTVALLIPRSIWADRPPPKVREGTQVQYGMDAYRPRFESSRVYGLAGEFMLNFGPALVPLVFSVLGFVVGRTRRMMAHIDSHDARWLLVPFLINLCFVVLGMDSDNVLVFSLKNGLLPVCVVYIGSQVVVRHPAGNTALAQRKPN